MTDLESRLTEALELLGECTQVLEFVGMQDAFIDYDLTEQVREELAEFLCPTAEPQDIYAKVSQTLVTTPETTDPFGKLGAGGWYEWEGNGDFRPAGLVDVVFRDEVEVPRCNATAWDWDHLDSEGDIVKWRPAQ